MRFAYADPPYIGCAKRYAGGKEVNHRMLVAHLEDDFDGWALSMHSRPDAVAEIIGHCDSRKPSLRLMAWVKHYAPSRPGVMPVYSWEPVLLRPLPRPGREASYQRDWLAGLASGMTTPGRSSGQRILGEKPPDFCRWVFECARLHPDDDFTDVFPGSGAVMEAWRGWRESRRPEPLQLEVTT